MTLVHINIILNQDTVMLSKTMTLLNASCFIHSTPLRLGFENEVSGSSVNTPTAPGAGPRLLHCWVSPPGVEREGCPRVLRCPALHLAPRLGGLLSVPPIWLLLWKGQERKRKQMAPVRGWIMSLSTPNPPENLYVEALILRTSECDSIWKQVI